jgi:acyl-CoA synthetase (AMP-forming)/AMP-acid ligase II
MTVPNRTAYTEAISLGDALLRTAEARPDHVAVAMPEGSWTYGQLAERAVRIARNLIGAGIRPGDHVGVLMPNSFEILATCFGISLAGAVIVPINARFRTREIGFVVENADLACVVTSDANDAYANYLDLVIESIGGIGDDPDPLALQAPGAPRLRSLVVLGTRKRAGVLDEEAFDALGAQVDEAEVHRRRLGISVADRAMVLYTSGTTSQPRGALISHESLVRVWGVAVANAMRFTAADRVWNPCPMFHIAALGVSIACVYVGATIVTAKFFEPDSAVEVLVRERATAWYPAYANILLGVLEHKRFPEIDMSVADRVLVVGPPKTLYALQERMPGCTIVSTFGMTESCGCSTAHDVDDPLEVRCETVGPPIPGLEMRIVDPDSGEVLGPDERGEIQLRGPILFDGYYKDEEKTRNTFTEDGWMRTGDLGSMDAEGRAQYHGRIKDMIRVGGENMAPAEVEAHLMTHPAVLLAQVVGIPDERLDEVPVAFVELREGASATEEELIEHCRGAIARFKVPRHVRFVTEWPMSATKVQKYKLRERMMAELGIAANA